MGVKLNINPEIGTINPFDALVAVTAQAAAAAASAVSADADATATADDRVQTGLDRTQCDDDAVATAADRVQTGLDRTQTGLDRASAAASAAGAETAQGLAEAARDASSAAGGAYLSIAAGLAATANGEVFRVAIPLPSGVSIDLYKNNAGVEEYINSVPSSTTMDFTYTPLCGYSFVVIDSENKILFAVTNDNVFIAPSTAAINAVRDDPTAMSDVAFAVITEDEQFPFGVGTDGNLIHKGEREIDLARLWQTVSSGNPTSIIDCLGDSLTHGNTVGVTTPYPSALAALLPGRTINNLGKSGRTSLQIATAFGAVPSILTVASNTIPTSGAVSVTTTENGNFSSKSNLGTISVAGMLDGIHGTLAVGYNSVTPELPGVTTFTRTAAGTAKIIPNRSPFILDTADGENNTVVIWSGVNDIISGYTNDVILANIQAQIDFLYPLKPRFIILSVLDAAAWANGSAEHTQVLSLNYELSRRWPRNFIDIRKILVNSYDAGAPADVTAFGNNKVPPSLQIDGLHLTDAGYAIVAQSVHDFLIIKGW